MPQYYYNPFANTDNEDEQMRRNFQLQLRIKQEKKELRTISIGLGIAIIIYLVIQTYASMALAKNSELYSLYKESAVFQYAFNVIFVSVLSVAVPFGIFALINKGKYKSPVFPSKPIKASKCFQWVCFGMGCCILANIIVSYIIVFFKTFLHLELTQGDSLKPTNLIDCIMCVIAIAIIPAICEEFAMRCCALQLLKNYGKGFAVCAVSVVFGLLHGNVIQFVFAFLVGLVLAYVTIKTDSIVPAILIHLLNNGMSAVQDIVKLYAGEDASEDALVVMFIAWIALGVVCAILLMINREFKKSQDISSSILSTGDKISAFLFPGMIVPFFLLILITVTTVKRI